MSVIQQANKKSKSILDVNQEKMALFGTGKNTYVQFPPGARVRVICVCQDFTFFSGEEKGTVIENSKDYLGIIVEFDEPIEFGDGRILKDFNFEPQDLLLLVPEYLYGAEI